MKKRVFSILTALCLCLTLLPVAAFATEESSAAPAEEPQQEQQEEVNPEANPEQPEGQPEVNPAEQPAAENSVPVALSGEGETVIKLTPSNISNYMSSGLTDGSYQLGGDVTIESGSLEVKGTVTLDLNGHTLLFKDPELYYPPIQGQVNAGIRVYNSDSSESAAKYALTLCDTSTAKTGTLDVWGESMAESGEGLFVGQNGELTMTGGTITDSSGTNPWGIGIGIIEGEVTMTGGKIENQTRCGVTLAGGTFEMSGDAVISNCGGNNSGGGIWIGGGTFTMSGGTIKNCNATQGGGVYVGAGTFIMTGGSIVDCTASTTDYTMAMGGGVCLDGGTFTMSGGTITGCKSGEKRAGSSNFCGGGGVYVGGAFNMSGSARITNCEATFNSGGGVLVGGTFTMTGGTIENCKADASGGGVATYKDDSGLTTFTMTGGTIKKCKALKANGGGVFVFYSNFELSGNASITDCTAMEYGDCILIDRSNATFTVNDSNITINGQIMQYFGSALINGLGTAKFPYQIGDKAELVLFGSIVNGTAGNYIPAQRGACAELTADVDLENDAWTPIGQNTGDDPKDTLAYSGTFNGNGHTISGLNVTGEFAYSGLFGYTEGAAIRDLTVAGKVTSTSTDSSTAVGGIIGRAKGSTIENCGNLCAVTAPAGHTGGIVGYAAYMDDSSGWITGCYNAGKISGGDYAGGIVGTHYDDMFIYDCYNVGAISGNRAIGGIAGSGSFVMLFNCYNAGIVVCPGGTATPGGLFGNGSGQVRNSYYLKGTTADSHIGAIEKSAEEFADGTVLKALKDGKHKSEDPWADECQYVDAAGLTLPVFKNQNTHKHQDPLEHVPAKAPTTSADGNIEYWYCPACGRYFADANGDHEITQAETVIPKRHFSGSSSSSYPITVPDKTENGSVAVSPKTASKGSTVTITVTPDSGYVLETISVTDKNGNDLKLTDKGNGKYTFTMPGSKVEVKVTFMEDNSVLNFFYDVPNDAYYYEAVKWAAENGITGGVGNSLFAPNQPCTRAQIVTFLWRVAGSPVVNYLMPFTDVDEGAYYAEAVRWAASTGIVTGLTETTFGTNDGCTRAQAAAMIYRYVQEQGKGFTGAWMFLLPFTDVPEWAYESVAWCYMNGVTTGVSETSFAPGKDCTRAQIVTFLWRAFSK